MPVFCLAMHAAYVCRHAGACCSSGWTIPVEPDAARAIDARFGGARLIPLQPSGGPAGALVRTAVLDDGTCAFFDAAHGRLCEIHRDLGPSALPSVCRHFPRTVLATPRGTFVSLSHFCPTAAELLFDGADAAIVDAPGTLSLDGTAEGLDARDVLPPLLRPGMLMDDDGYAAWERSALTLLTDRRRTVDASLSTLASVTGIVQRWAPGKAALAGHALHAFTQTPFSDDVTPADPLSDFALACASVPDGLGRPAAPPLARPARVADLWDEFDRPIRRYLAARLFASWLPYSARGLDVVVRGLRVHASVLRVEIARRAAAGGGDRSIVLEAIRAADLLMVHLSDTRTLAALLEQSP